MKSSILTKEGDRELNEDSVGTASFERWSCYVVADGLGGHDRGEVASALVKDTALEIFQKTFKTSPMDQKEMLEKVFLEGQTRLIEKQKTMNSEMKTTMVMLLADEQYCQWAHVGDSRLYYFKDGSLVKRTLDHSVPQMLVRTGEIREKEIRHHEDRNRLLRVIGIEWDSPKFELSDPVKLEEGQAFLLCTDGFWEWIEEREMEKLLQKAESPDDWLNAMEQVIRKNGSGHNMDNYSAVAVFTGAICRRKKLFGIFGI